MNMSPLPFEEVDHTADWALRVWGATVPELFVNAARGMYHLVGAERQGGATVYRPVNLQALDLETLLVDWLTELLYRLHEHNEAFDTLQIESLTAERLQACVAGGPASPLDKYIKAATFHNLRIIRAKEGYEVTVVFDV